MILLFDISILSVIYLLIQVWKRLHEFVEIQHSKSIYKFKHKQLKLSRRTLYLQSLQSLIRNFLPITNIYFICREKFIHDVTKDFEFAYERYSWGSLQPVGDCGTLMFATGSLMPPWDLGRLVINGRLFVLIVWWYQ